MFDTVKYVMFGIMYITGLIGNILFNKRKKGNRRIIKMMFVIDLIFSLSGLACITLDIISSQEPHEIIRCVICLALIAIIVLYDMLEVRKYNSKK